MLSVTLGALVSGLFIRSKIKRYVADDNFAAAQDDAGSFQIRLLVQRNQLLEEENRLLRVENQELKALKVTIEFMQQHIDSLQAELDKLRKQITGRSET